MNPLFETWAIHNRINLYLLDAIPEVALGHMLGGKGRSVRDQFVHLHNVRLMWLKSAAPELLQGLEKLESKLDYDKGKLRSALESSGLAVGMMLNKAIAAGGKVKG